MTMLAEVTGSPLDFAKEGILGLVIVAVLLGWFWAKPAVDRLVKDHQRELADLRADYVRTMQQRDDLFQTMEVKVIPALLESNQISTALKPVLEEVVLALEEVRQSAHRGRDA